MSIHIARPEKLRRGKSWACKCRTINSYENVECKMILIEKIALEQKLERARNPPPKKTGKEYAIEREKRREEEFREMNPYEAVLKGKM